MANAKGGCLPIVGGLVAIGFVASMCSGGNGTGDTGGASGGSGSTAAWMACKDAVKGELNNPETADFALLDTTMEDDFIDGKLTAENSYGVAQELQFHCDMTGGTVGSVEVLPTR